MSIDTRRHGVYCTAEQEDSAVAEALSRFGYLGRYLDLRTASNFDQPYPGETIKTLLATFPGFSIATENAYRVGAAMARYLMTRAGRARAGERHSWSGRQDPVAGRLRGLSLDQPRDRAVRAIRP